MARIRSIKPEFFTSVAMSRLPLSTRLTFIGLWTYVDDNGVGLDNERLVLAAVWPLEDDVIATLQRTREDLRRLAGAGHIQRYRSGSGAFLYISTWDEHQKVSHPRKPRYPCPSEAVTSPNGTPEILRSGSGGTPEALRPEQGAGSREQGAGNTTAGVVTPSVEVPMLPAEKAAWDTVIAARSYSTEQERQLERLAQFMRDHPETVTP